MIASVVKTIKHPVVLALLAAVILYICYMAFKKFFKKSGNKLPDNKPTQLPSCPSCAKPTHLPVCPDCVKPAQLL